MHNQNILYSLRTLILLMVVFLLSVVVMGSGEANKLSIENIETSPRSTPSPTTFSEPTILMGVYDPPPGSSAKPIQIGEAFAFSPSFVNLETQRIEIRGQTAYVDLDTLIVIYTNTAMGSINKEN